MLYPFSPHSHAMLQQLLLKNHHLPMLSESLSSVLILYITIRFLLLPVNGFWHSGLHKYVSKYKYALQISQTLYILNRKKSGVLLVGDYYEVFYYLISYSVHTLYFKICLVFFFFPLSKSLKDFGEVFILDYVPSGRKDSLTLSNANGFFS